MKLGYPNAFDLQKAKEDGRGNNDLGGDIYIHGSNGSAGCLAMGDEAIEELFVLTQRVGMSNVSVLISPCDMRTGAKPQSRAENPPWTKDLHEDISRKLRAFSRR